MKNQRPSLTARTLYATSLLPPKGQVGGDSQLPTPKTAEHAAQQARSGIVVGRRRLESAWRLDWGRQCRLRPIPAGLDEVDLPDRASSLKQMVPAPFLPSSPGNVAPPLACRPSILTSFTFASRISWNCLNPTSKAAVSRSFRTSAAKAGRSLMNSPRFRPQARVGKCWGASSACEFMCQHN